MIIFNLCWSEHYKYVYIYVVEKEEKYNKFRERVGTREYEWWSAIYVSSYLKMEADYYYKAIIIRCMYYCEKKLEKSDKAEEKETRKKSLKRTLIAIFQNKLGKRMHRRRWIRRKKFSKIVILKQQIHKYQVIIMSYCKYSQNRFRECWKIYFSSALDSKY